MIIQFYVKNVYGVNNMYILDDRQAKLVQTLTGRKTINQSDIEALTELAGCAWVQVFAPTTK
jgi:hypothetical protein